MRIWTVSDFQLDANPEAAFLDLDVEADVMVVAGDAHPPLTRSIMRLAPIAKLMPVIYVPGNRDFYSRVMAQEMELARAAVASVAKGVHLLSDDVFEIDGVRFIGSTLWSDLEMGGAKGLEGDLSYLGRLNDFRVIKLADDRPFTPKDYVELHRRSRAFIEATLAHPFDGATVVVSHHSPHPKSTGPEYVGDSLDPAFGSDLSAILEGPNAPDLWVHGGMHRSHEYKVGRTRVLQNGRGYHGENRDFVPGLVIEVKSPVAAPAY